MAISVAVAVGDVADSLVERLAARARNLKVGPGLTPDVEMGPLVTAAHRDRVAGYVADGSTWHSLRLVADGETVLEAQDVTRLDGWWTLTPGEHTFWLEGKIEAGSPTERSASAIIVVE